MKKCEKCNTPLSFKIVFIAFWNGYLNFACKNCSAKYKFKFKDRVIGGFVIGISTFISSLIISILSYYDLDYTLKMISGLVAMVVLGLLLSALSTSLFSFEREED
jgi:CXXC-20-CXXC protein